MFLIVLLAVAMAGQPPSTVSTEMLAMNVPDEFQVGNHQRDDTSEIIELVKPPETVDTWSKLVTSMIFFDAAKAGLDTFDVRWREGLRNDCPGMKDSVVRGRVDGHPALRHLVSCAQNPQTGKPENLSAVLVEGNANLLLAQVAFRHEVMPPDHVLIEHVIGSLKVCDERTLDSCKARKATGFVATP